MRQPFKVYPRPDHGNWWVNFRLNGKRFRLDTGVARPRGDVNEAEATRKGAALWLAECGRQGVEAALPESIELDTLTMLGEWVDGPLADHARKRNPRYAAQIETDIARHVVPRFPLLTQITVDSWNQAQLDMQDEERPLSLRTCQRVTVSLRLFLKFCEKRRVLVGPKLETATAEEVAATQKDRRPFTKSERDRFLRSMRRLDDRAHRIYTALLYSALRKGASEKMLPRWIDWRTHYVTFPAGTLKNRKPRSFYLHPLARQAIRAELAARGSLDPDQPVFGRFDFDDHRQGLFWLAVRAAKIPEHGLTAHHVTRHTACTIAAQEGATFAELMALGGWRTPAMALRYMNIDGKLSRGAVERL